MTYVLTLGNQKGGCSKTSSTINLAYALASKGKKVLVIDMDSQGSASLNLGIDIGDEETNTIDEMLDDMILKPNEPVDWEVLRNYIYEPTYQDRKRNPENPMKWIDCYTPFGFYVMPSSLNLSVVELKMGLAGGASRQGIRTDYLSKITDCIAQNTDIEYILIDTPPSLGALSMNSMAAAKEGIIIISNVDVMSVRGISTFIETSETIKKLVPGHRGILGIMFSLYKERRRIDCSINEWAKEFLPIPTFDTQIPESLAFKKANSAMLLASQIDKGVREAFESLADEVIYAVENPTALVGSAKEASNQNGGDE
jgi:chromosome partitioning protein